MQQNEAKYILNFTTFCDVQVRINKVELNYIAGVFTVQNFVLASKYWYLNSIEHSPCWEANSDSGSQEIILIYDIQRFIIMFISACV
jgi:hypothetical protein